MQIDQKIKDLGFNEDIIKYFHNRTKLSKFNILEVFFDHREVINGKTSLVCLKVKIDNKLRPVYTMNVTEHKLIKMRRDIIISKILE
jgi:hypothetical protein